MTRTCLGKVYLVGAGPSDPELITLKGKRCIEAADAILYDDLVNRELLEFAADDTELIYVGKKPDGHCADQREIEARLIRYACAGKTVVRLKGGDPFVFGRGGEEAQALRVSDIPFEVVPGVSSAIAVPVPAGIPVTHRSYASSVAIVTGHKTAGDEVKWGELARAVDTLVILMGMHILAVIIARLQASGCEPEKPVALIQSGTLATKLASSVP
jgi:uroporphyrin-III C-methyltransferase